MLNRPHDRCAAAGCAAARTARRQSRQAHPSWYLSFKLIAGAVDQWKATPRLTINLGLRYDRTFQPPYGASDSVGENGGIETGAALITNAGVDLIAFTGSCLGGKAIMHAAAERIAGWADNGT